MVSPPEISLAKKLGADICLSGGAAGADVAWGDAAASIGHTVVHWSFKGHKPATNENVYILNQDELNQADPFLERANISLKRYIPYNKPWIVNLLRRNYYQIKYADAVYAIGELEDHAIKRRQNDSIGPKESLMGVQGGTGWACQIYHDRWDDEKDDHELHPITSDDLSISPAKWFPWFRLIFYDQSRQQVYRWLPHGPVWYRIELFDVERPQGIYAAIGTRKLNDHGQSFINSLFS